MILICISCFIKLFIKNVFLRTTLDYPVILDGQFSGFKILTVIRGIIIIAFVQVALYVCGKMSALCTQMWKFIQTVVGFMALLCHI
jgi:hypothetical protein